MVDRSFKEKGPGANQKEVYFLGKNWTGLLMTARAPYFVNLGTVAMTARTAIRKQNERAKYLPHPTVPG